MKQALKAATIEDLQGLCNGEQEEIPDSCVTGVFFFFHYYCIPPSFFSPKISWDSIGSLNESRGIKAAMLGPLPPTGRDGRARRVLWHTKAASHNYSLWL